MVDSNLIPLAPYLTISMLNEISVAFKLSSIQKLLTSNKGFVHDALSGILIEKLLGICVVMSQEKYGGQRIFRVIMQKE